MLATANYLLLTTNFSPMNFSNPSHLFGLITALVIVAAVAVFVSMRNDTQEDAAGPKDAASSQSEAAASETPQPGTAPKPPGAAPVGAVIKTNFGEIEVAFFRDKAPKTVENFETLTKAGFYASTKFHRIIKDFMIQGGDPFSKDDAQMARWGTGGPGYTFADEINSEKIVRGVLAMANAGPNTNGSQFFIVTAEAAPWLDGRHTAFGRVVRGMDVVNKISAAPTGENDIPKSPVIIESITLK